MYRCTNGTAGFEANYKFNVCCNEKPAPVLIGVGDVIAPKKNRILNLIPYYISIMPT